MRFCQKNKIDMNQTTLKHQHLLAFSMGLYFVSVTFKEAALMLGPVMIMYLCISAYRKISLAATLSTLLHQPDVRRIFLLVTVVAITLAVYLSMAWPSFTHPAQHAEATGSPLSVLIQLLKILFGFRANVTFPPVAEWTLRILLGLLLAGTYFIFTLKNNADPDLLLTYRKSFLFLSVAVLAFMVMPIIWGRGRPWHLALSLTFLSLMVGFSIDYCCHAVLANKLRIKVIEITLAVAFGLIGFAVASSNVNYFRSNQAGFASRLDRNAVLHPPTIKNQLNAESVVIVEDSIVRNDYLLGDSIYPIEPFVDGIDMHRLLLARSFYEFPPVYGSTLFKWAYLMPELKEQIYLFQVDKMQTIPAITIYNWLQHYDNIFCLGYDSDGVWHDRTLAFKKNLLLEKARRNLSVYRYQILPTTALNADTKAMIRLPFADPAYCQFRCDANKSCKGFTYAQSGKHGQIAQCYFSSINKKLQMNTCENCKLFIKI
jgi:hypothetical protein